MTADRSGIPALSVPAQGDTLRTSARRPILPASLASLAILAVGAALPLSASAQIHRAAGLHARQASRVEERAARAEQRAAERAARAQERATRAEQRKALHAEQRAARAQERAARREARSGSARGDSGAGVGTGSGSTAEVPAAPSAAPQPAGAASGKCEVSIDASSHRISAGEAVTVFGKLTCPPTTDAGAHQITVYEGHAGIDQPGSAAFASATSQADGTFALPPAVLQANTVFRVRVGNHGARTVVKVAPLVTLSAPSLAAQSPTTHGHASVAPRNKATFSGSVSPAQAGTRVVLQVSDAAAGEQWRALAFGEVGADGKYSITHGLRTAGAVSFRVVARAKGHTLVPGVSEALDYEIPQAQNPQLTIKSSADPISLGQTATISGVSAAGANRTVTLLAHVGGGAFVALATTTTGEGGEYKSPRARRRTPPTGSAKARSGRARCSRGSRTRSPAIRPPKASPPERR